MGKSPFLKEPEDPDLKFTVIICSLVLLYFAFHVIRSL